MKASWIWIPSVRHTILSKVNLLSVIYYEINGVCNQYFLNNHTPLSALRSIADKKFLRVVSQCAYNILSNHTLCIVLPTYILNVLHIVRSPPIANGSVRQASLTGDDEHGTSRVVQEKEADWSKFGWKATNEYEEDDSASDSADEKCVFRSERRVERQVRSSQKKQR